ncbi:putative glycosyltransferase [Trifolium repens]|nr:putative glycosyltransferase [Trifolium repens]
MEICCRKLISMLFLASFTVIFMVMLPLHWMRSTTAKVKPSYNSVSLHELRTNVYDKNDHLFAVQPAGRHLNATVAREVRKVKNREEKREEGLARARSSIRKVALGDHRSNLTPSTPHNDGYIPAGAVYHNPRLFYQSYLEMERIFKVYVYPDGDLPIVHDGPCKDIYSIEGRFLHEMEHGVGKFRTNDPNAAHVYFLPFSVTWMVKYLYTPSSYDMTPLKDFVSDYVKVVSMRYPFWNRTRGADHFMLACHDWGPNASKGNSFLYNNSIRVLCNANTSEGFNPLKDVSLPEIHLFGGEISPKLLSLPPDDAPRRHLAFFAGGMHGPIRPILLNHWKNRDNDIRVYEYLPKDLDYYSLMLNSKFCLCPSGHEVASPRIVESIYAECVPVILSDYYVLPFSDVLRWEAFSVQVDVSDISRLKEVLSAIPETKYRNLKQGVRAVRKHFTLNQPAKRFDVFHMILHSIWLRRLNIKLG